MDSENDVETGIQLREKVKRGENESLVVVVVENESSWQNKQQLRKRFFAGKEQS